MRSLAAACALVAIAHADASLPGTPLAPPRAPVRTTHHFTTRWTRLVECKQLGKVSLFASGGSTAKWSGPAGEVSFSAAEGERGLVERQAPRDAPARLTELTVELMQRHKYESVQLSAKCLDAPVEYQWLCSMQWCTVSKSTTPAADALPASWSEPAMRATMAALGKLDAAAASARRDEFLRVARRLIADAAPSIASACKLGCKSEAERSVQPALKLISSPLRFVGAEPASGNVEVFLRDVAAVSVAFDHDDGLVRVTCGTGTLAPDRAPDTFCEVEVNRFSLLVSSMSSSYMGEVRLDGASGGTIFLSPYEFSVHESVLQLAP
ncbi:MAG TPA: hypothetical protein VFF06_12230 [Polyangia bacterium]|nr:hypothetical protein [Polyangia bacterium]